MHNESSDPILESLQARLRSLPEQTTATFMGVELGKLNCEELCKVVQLVYEQQRSHVDQLIKER